MGETTRQIAEHIEHTREDLGVNLQELEYKVKSVTDWRQQFRNNPMMMVGLAFGGGVFLATMTGGTRNRLARMSSTESSTRGLASHVASQASASPEKEQLLETWDNIKGAMVGVAASRLKSFLADAIPGFEEQLRETGSQQARAFRPRTASTMPDRGSAAT